MAEKKDGPAPAGPLLREYAPTGVFRQTSARTASVLFYRKGGYSVATASGIEHFDRRPLARPHTVCEIALGTYETTLKMELPAKGGASFFQVEIDIHWTVTDPHLAATEVVTDVAKRLTAPILERLREVSSDFPVAEAEQANRAITSHCAGGRWGDLGSDLGLRVRLYVRMRMDDRTITHMDDIREAHASAEVTRVHQEKFRAMLQGGELDQLSYMLAAEPEAAKDFLEKIRQEGRQDEKDRVDRLFDMVDSGQIQSNELETQALALLNRGRRPVQGPVGSLPAHRRPPAPELEPGDAEPYSPDWLTEEEPPAPRRRRPGPSEPEDRAPEPPRRRSRDADDGWSWAEED